MSRLLIDVRLLSLSFLVSSWLCDAMTAEEALIADMDSGVGCKVDDLDVSPAVFEKVADLDLGRVLVEWSWLENSPVASSQP